MGNAHKKNGDKDPKSKAASPASDTDLRGEVSAVVGGSAVGGRSPIGGSPAGSAHSSTILDESPFEVFPYGHEIINRPSPVGEDEDERIQRLLSYEILDSEKEKLFDDVAVLASFICGTPMAAITLVDSARVWIKAGVGIAMKELPRDVAMCSYTIQAKETFVVPNLLQDERFANNPSVLSMPNLRFYAGAPLITAEGFALGSICALDCKPRELTDMQKQCLESLSRQVITLIDARTKLREFKVVVADLRATESALIAAKESAEAANVSSVEHLMLSSDGFEAFRVHLREEFSEENLLFYQDCKEYKLTFSRRMIRTQTQLELINEESKNTKLAQATNEVDTQLVFQNRVKLQVDACYQILSIYAHYLAEGATKEVNLPATTRGELLATLNPLIEVCQAPLERAGHLNKAPTFQGLARGDEREKLEQEVLEEFIPRQTLEDLIRSKKFIPTEDIFEVAQSNILKLLREDSYRRFKASHHYTALLRKVGEMGKQRLKDSHQPYPLTSPLSVLSDSSFMFPSAEPSVVSIASR